MKRRWINLLFLSLVIMIAALYYHLFNYAKATAAASLIINLLKPLNILLAISLFFVIFRSLMKIYLGTKHKVPGFNLRLKLVFAILPLTLVPALIIFFLATRFLDDILLDLEIDQNVAKLVEDSDQLSNQYLADVRDLHLGHAAGLADLVPERGTRPSVRAVRSYLNKHALDGIEYYRPGEPLVRVMASAFPMARLENIEDSAEFPLLQESTRYDDGFFVARFPFTAGNLTLHLIYVKETPFTERYVYIRDSYEFLQHTRRKTEKVKGVNQGILLITTLAVIFGGIWTGLAFADRFVGAFNVLIAGAERVAKGDFDTVVDLRSGDEIENLGNAFNAMTAQLKSHQHELEQKARDLEGVNAEFAGQIQYSQTILQRINSGILSTDRKNRVLSSNPAIFRVLGLETIEVGSPIEEVFTKSIHQPLLAQWQEHRHKGFIPVSKQLELIDEDLAMTLHVAAHMVPLLKDGERFGSLIVIEDLTQLLNAQKLAAWREVAKRVAHEIKNPLTPIQLSIQRIHRKAEKDAPDLKNAIQSGYETIMGETDLLKNLVNEFSTFAKLPAPAKVRTDLAKLVGSLAESYEPVFPATKLEVRIGAGDFVIHCDPSQLRQVLGNLLSNAAQASPADSCVTVGLETDGSTRVTLTVSDQGIGIPEEEKAKIFIPYYSKSAKGTGLGLAIVQRIIEDHDGSISVRDNQPRGTIFEITLPK